MITSRPLAITLLALATATLSAQTQPPPPSQTQVPPPTQTQSTTPTEAPLTQPAKAQDSLDASKDPRGDASTAEDIYTGYRKTAELKRADWERLKTKNLPDILRLGTQNPCTNDRAIGIRMDSLRTAAREYFLAYATYLKKWNDDTEKDMDNQQKFWADMKAHRTDLPALIKNEETTLEEYKRKQAALAPQDEDTRSEYDKLIDASQKKLELLRKTLVDSASIDDNIKSSQEFWATKLETTKKYMEVLDTLRQSTELQYDSVVQQYKTACNLKKEPQVLKDLGITKK